MRNRIVTWGSVALTLASVVCAVLSFRVEGWARTALLITSGAAALLGIAGLLFGSSKMGEERRRRNEQKEAEERALFAQAKFIYLLYCGKKKRLAAPAQNDTFFFIAYRSDDREAVERYARGQMPKQQSKEFARRHESVAAHFFPTLSELEEAQGKVFFVDAPDCEIMRTSPAYRTFVSRNEIVAP